MGFLKILLILLMTLVLAGAGTYLTKGWLARKLDNETPIVEAIVYMVFIYVCFAVVIGAVLLFVFLN